jgi:hypothetical protein
LYCKYELLGQQCDPINEGFTEQQCTDIGGETSTSPTCD